MTAVLLWLRFLSLGAKSHEFSDPGADLFRECLERVSPNVTFRPENCGQDAGWEALITPVNPIYFTCPLAFMFANSPTEVQGALTCAKLHDVKVTARSGGHSYAGYSRGETNGLVISTELLSGLEILTPESTPDAPAANEVLVSVGAGNRLGRIYYQLWLLGRGIAGGTCPTVGTSIVLGGGQGPYARAHGLLSDNLVSCEVVLASGEIVTANATNEYADLFWGLRGGGGGNLGIVTNYVLKPFVVTSFYSLVRIFAVTPTAVSRTICALAAWQASENGRPDNNLGIYLTVGFGIAQITVMFEGHQDDLLRAINPLQSMLVTQNLSVAVSEARLSIDLPGTDSVEVTPLGPPWRVGSPFYEELLSRDKKDALKMLPVGLRTIYEALDSPGDFGSDVIVSPVVEDNQINIYLLYALLIYNVPVADGLNFAQLFRPNRTYSRLATKYLDQGQSLQREACEGLSQILNFNPTTPGTVAVLNVELLGGRVSDLSHDHSAYAHRQAGLIFEWLLATNGSDIDVGDIQAMESMVDKAVPYLTPYSYINLMEKTFANGTSYYRDHFQRLAELAKKYDPEKRFDFPLSIHNMVA